MHAYNFFRNYSPRQLLRAEALGKSPCVKTLAVTQAYVNWNPGLSPSLCYLTSLSASDGAQKSGIAAPKASPQSGGTQQLAL